MSVDLNHAATPNEARIELELSEWVICMYEVRSWRKNQVRFI